MRYVLVELDFYSPYVSTPFFAEQGAGPPLPPPLTLVGALSAVYHYPEEVRGIPSHILKSVKYVAFWAPPYATVVNISRHFSGLSQRKERLKVLTAAEKLVSGAVDEEVTNYVVGYSGKYRYHNAEEKIKVMDAFRADVETYGRYDVAKSVAQVLQQPSSVSETYFYTPRVSDSPEDRAYVLYVLDGELEDKLAKMAGEIYRAGQKETLVAATPLSVRVEQLQSGTVRTRFYVPRGAVANSSNCRTVYMLALSDVYVIDSGDVFNSTSEYCVPGPSGYMVVEPKRGWVGVKIVSDSGVKLEALIPEYAAP